MRKTLINIIFLIYTCVIWAQEPISDSITVKKDSLPSVSVPDTSQNLIPPTTSTISTPVLNPENSNKLVTRFANQIVEFKKGELISNVFIVTNNLPNVQKFYIDFTIPIEWKVIAKNHTLYELQPGDSLIIPVNIIPRERFKGNTRFMFYAFLSDEKGKNLGMNFFYGLIKKNIRWALTVSDNKIYIPNKVESIPFTIGVVNESTEEQDIYLTASSFKKNILIKDSTDTKDAYFPITVTLKPFGDTLFNFNFHRFKEPRNFRLLDIEDYIPYSTGEAKKYRLNLNSYSPNPAENKKFRTGNKIDFIELSDTWEVNKYGGLVIPLIFDANMFNLLGDQPMMTVNLRGETFLRDSSMLTYQTQLTYFSNYFTTVPYENALYNLGYYHKKFYIQFGNVSSGLIGTYQTGKGLRGEYYFNRNHRIGAFYVASPQLFKFMPSIYSYGLNHFYENKIVRVNTILGRSTDQIRNTNTEIATTNASFKFLKSHSFGIRLGGSHSVQNDSNYTRLGYLLGLNYSGSPIKKIWALNFNGNYTSPSFGVFSNERITVNLGNQVTIKKKWLLKQQSNLYRYKQNYYGLSYSNYFLNNQLFINNATPQSNLLYNPYLFYNVSRILDFTVHSRGLGFNVSNYKLDKNVRYFFNIRSGYNQAMDTINKNYFFTQAAAFLQIRTWSFLVRYNLGNLSMSKQSFFYNSAKNPQSIGLSTRYQYQFKNPSFVYQQLVSYSYSSFNGNQFNFTPEIMYFSRTGWRFRLFSEINFSKNKKNSLPDYYYFMNQAPNEEIKEPQWNSNFYLGMGVRKEFGIPIPFVKPTHTSIQFNAFYDTNGNGKHEGNEPNLENVVVRLNGWEVMTNENGLCGLKNIAMGAYPLQVFSVIDLKGWFPNISDTLVVNKNTNKVNIPFVRGVKITGKVFIQRDPNSPSADFKLDVSRIKIIASNHKTYTALTDKNGYYELYLPAGKYILSMDESILGKRLELMQNNFELEINDKFDNLFIPFYIVEKARKLKVIRFDSNGNRIDE
ncbi:MAG: hypothetical protein HPY79_04415 [Bacteroidales bacterium]|nr:hypothetical protein [Bacteroidales bacterium]